MSLKKAIRAAVKLYRDFREKEPKKIGVVEVTLPAAVMVIGYVDEIFYTTSHKGRKVQYRHPFQDGSRPLLVASSDGKQLLLLGGFYKFTARGIVDRNPDGSLNFDPDHGADEADVGYGPGFMRRKQAD